MTDAIAATLLSYKTVPTRKVFQMVLELPIEKAADAIKLFGTPDSDGATWLAVARLIGPDASAQTGAVTPAARVSAPLGAPQGQGKVRHLSQDAALKCKDPAFQAWMAKKASVRFDGGLSAEKREAATVMFLKAALDIVSRRELDTDPAKAKAWDSLLADFEYRDAVR